MSNTVNARMSQLAIQGSRLKVGFRTWEYKVGTFKSRLFIAPMFSRLTTALALALALVSFSAPATAASPCGVCSPFMFFSGVNRTLVLQREEEMNTVQCEYLQRRKPSKPDRHTLLPLRRNSFFNFRKS
ncbi:hypothetical protein C8R44DRAFT_920315 [Mycena epipterygia]|nr:hypothetical protein C8R44DRAFT_920315 [Mycena epipterygia]